MTALTIGAAVLAGLYALLISVNARRIGDALGLLDWPDPRGGRKLHAVVTPLLGGAAVVPGALLGALIGWAGEDFSPYVAAHLGWFAVVVGLLFLIGLADDRLGLGPRLRLLFSLLVFGGAVVYASDFRVSFLLFSGSPAIMLAGGPAILFSLVCLAGLLNAVNMADGKNGLVISLSAFWAFMLWLSAPAYLDPLFAALAVGLAIAFVFNMRGRLFLGDGGSYGLSAIIGLLAIYTYNHGFERFTADRLALLFAVPVFDTLRLITRRSLKGHSPFKADRDHLHHHVAYRWGWPRGLAIYLAVVGVPNLVAMALPALGPAMLGLTLTIYVAVLVLSTRRTAFSSELPAREPAALHGAGTGATSDARDWGVAKR